MLVVLIVVGKLFMKSKLTDSRFTGDAEQGFVVV
jgi:hypothetical protein